MNRSLARIHLGLVIFYGLIAAIICTMYLAGNKSDTIGILILLAMFGVLPTLHLVALRGVRTGRAWGRWLSRTLGFFLLFAVPIGTILGIFVLMRTRRKDWEHAP
jgi:hypothetical protein